MAHVDAIIDPGRTEGLLDELFIVRRAVGIGLGVGDETDIARFGRDGLETREGGWQGGCFVSSGLVSGKSLSYQ